MSSIQLHILDRPKDALKILVPALLYLLQNSLLYVALSNLTAPIFQVTYQGKLVTTAVVSVIMLQRKYSFQQWVCLVALSLGVAIVVLGEKGGSKENEEGGGCWSLGGGTENPAVNEGSSSSGDSWSHSDQSISMCIVKKGLRQLDWRASIFY